MPQLDTIYIFLIFMWTWLMLHLTVKKINTFLMTTGPKKLDIKNKKQMQTLPWT
uniref:ATP synthase F0 subunit 8 n=1 Tax=Opisthotropis guangxiensis TaxID=763643 RepID=A0A7T1W6T4_9SAUR|nr:ATP synthase F0 subunit 8 [Opisthotropis guangxiensis]QPO84664.1 ATP synthase F0 subunit 8 [Opisthotropis guangxiensis]